VPDHKLWNLKKELQNTNLTIEDLKQKNSLLQDKITDQDKTIEDLQN
jgi:predicted RNase H-like nuclease (RuvC/YqgF family)